MGLSTAVRVKYLVGSLDPLDVFVLSCPRVILLSAVRHIGPAPFECMANYIMSFIPSSSLLAIVVILSSFIVGYVVYDVFFNPLSKIPRAHWSVSIPYVGDWWILFQRYMERSNDMIILAHENHGPVVRLGYNELSVNCVDDGIRTIYGGAWEKHEFYPNLFVAYG